MILQRARDVKHDQRDQQIADDFVDLAAPFGQCFVGCYPAQGERAEDADSRALPRAWAMPARGMTRTVSSSQ